MSKFALFSVLVVLMSMYQPINSFGIVRVDVQKDPEIVNAIGRAISSKIQSLNTILSSFLALKSTYKTVNINTYGSNSGSSSSSSGSNSGSQVAYSTIPLYKKTINVNYGAAPIANTIEDSSDNASTSSTSSVASSGQAIFSAIKVVGGVTDTAASEPVSTSVAASTGSVSGSASGSASVASPNSVGYSYRKVYG